MIIAKSWPATLNIFEFSWYLLNFLKRLQIDLFLHLQYLMAGFGIEKFHQVPELP